MTKKKGRRKRNELAQVNEERTIVCMKKNVFFHKNLMITTKKRGNENIRNPQNYTSKQKCKGKETMEIEQPESKR